MFHISSMEKNRPVGSQKKVRMYKPKVNSIFSFVSGRILWVRAALL